MLSAVKVRISNHWTAREVLGWGLNHVLQSAQAGLLELMGRGVPEGGSGLTQSQDAAGAEEQ